ncbi:MAG: helix-turn-helix transcriptional regulator [Propionibacteriaceae bacterium]|nr:helix-turn-helix transcriptional regulator [Propionibacteriaceae bacterium]
MKRLKAETALSINELAGRSGLDRSTVIELIGGRRGVTDVRVGTLWALAWALEVEDFAEFLAPLTQRTVTELADSARPGESINA